jgi:hypothetical protein
LYDKQVFVVNPPPPGPRITSEDEQVFDIGYERPYDGSHGRHPDHRPPT